MTKRAAPVGRPVSTGRGVRVGKQVLVRLSAEEYRTLERAAERAGEPLAAWVRRVALENATLTPSPPMTDPTERLAAVLAECVRQGYRSNMGTLIFDSVRAACKVENAGTRASSEVVEAARTLLAELGLVAVPRELVEDVPPPDPQAEAPDGSRHSGRCEIGAVCSYCSALLALGRALAEQAKGER